jgi:hypothetical protein
MGQRLNANGERGQPCPSQSQSQASASDGRAGSELSSSGHGCPRSKIVLPFEIQLGGLTFL